MPSGAASLTSRRWLINRGVHRFWSCRAFAAVCVDRPLPESNFAVDLLNVSRNLSAGAFGAQSGTLAQERRASLERIRYIPGTLVAHSWRIPVHFSDLGF